MQQGPLKRQLAQMRAQMTNTALTMTREMMRAWAMGAATLLQMQTQTQTQTQTRAQTQAQTRMLARSPRGLQAPPQPQSGASFAA